MSFVGKTLTQQLTNLKRKVCNVCLTLKSKAGIFTPLSVIHNS